MLHGDGKGTRIVLVKTVRNTEMQLRGRRADIKNDMVGVVSAVCRYVGRSYSIASIDVIHDIIRRVIRNISAGQSGSAKGQLIVTGIGSRTRVVDIESVVKILGI